VIKWFTQWLLSLAHAAIDALLQVMAEQRLAPDEIESVHVGTTTGSAAAPTAIPLLS
jgi:2-methylcitrate dehydratase PrpD